MSSNLPNEKNKSDDTQIIDWKLTLERVSDNEDLAKEIFEMLISDLPSTQTAITRDCLAENYSALKNELHKLLGSCRYCGVPRLESITLKFENAVINNQVDQYRELLRILVDEINSVITVYKNMTPTKK